MIGVIPYIAYDRSSNTLSGSDIDILRILATTSKFRVNVNPEKSWGSVVNGSWTGTIGSVSYLIT